MGNSHTFIATCGELPHHTLQATVAPLGNRHLLAYLWPKRGPVNHLFAFSYNALRRAISSNELFVAAL